MNKPQPTGVCTIEEQCLVYKLSHPDLMFNVFQSFTSFYFLKFIKVLHILAVPIVALC